MRFLIFLLSLLFAGLANAPTSANDGKLVHVLRFTDYEIGSIDDWLQGKGFQFKLDARQRRNRIKLGVGPNGLMLEANRSALASCPMSPSTCPHSRISKSTGV